MTDRELMQRALKALEEGYQTHTPEFKNAITALRERLAQPEQGGKTGWPAGMLQDDSRPLSRWLASKPDARRHAREAAAAEAAQPAQQSSVMLNGPTEDHIPDAGKMAQPEQEPVAWEKVARLLRSRNKRLERANQELRESDE